MPPAPSAAGPAREPPALDAQAEGRAVGQGQPLVIQVIGENGLLVEGVLEVQALVVLVAAFLERVEAVDDDVARGGLDADPLQQRGQAHALPLADSAPPLNAVVPRD